MKGEHEKALVEGHEAVELNPSFALAYSQLAFSLVWAGRAEDAIRAFEKSMRLSPKDPFAWMKILGLGACHYFLGNIADAEKQFRHAENGRLVVPFAYAFLGLVLARQDRLEEAQTAIRTGLELNPEMTWERLMLNFGSLTPKYFDIIAEDAEKVGIQVREMLPLD